MNTAGLSVAIPDEIDVNIDDESIEYSEVYEAEDKETALRVAETTEALAKTFATNMEEVDGDEIDIDVDTEVDGDTITVDVVITPGRPEGAENIGIAAVAGEVMGTLSVADPLMWKAVVNSTEKSAEDMTKAMVDAIGE